MQFNFKIADLQLIPRSILTNTKNNKKLPGSDSLNLLRAVTPLSY